MSSTKNLQKPTVVNNGAIKILSFIKIKLIKNYSNIFQKILIKSNKKFYTLKIINLITKLKQKSLKNIAFKKLFIEIKNNKQISRNSNRLLTMWTRFINRKLSIAFRKITRFNLFFLRKLNNMNTNSSSKLKNIQ